eukprot:9467046-Pyramimonas_sp.AAC.1
METIETHLRIAIVVILVALSLLQLDPPVSIFVRTESLSSPDHVCPDRKRPSEFTIHMKSGLKLGGSDSYAAHHGPPKPSVSHNHATELR